ncbi:MAG: hypothetical protein AMXMBFR82_20910 [Candidatus Hydrogenedentota bacterium]
MIKFYHVAFAVFALPLVSALGIDHWFSRPRRVKELWPAILLYTTMGIVMASVYVFSQGYIQRVHLDEYVAEQVIIAAALALASLGIVAAYRNWNRPAVLVNLLSLVLVCDLLLAGRGTRPTLAPEYLYPETKLTQFLQGLPPPARVALGDGGIASGLMVPYGIEDWLGYDGLYPRRMTRFQTELGQDAWDSVEPTRSIEYVLNDPRYAPVFPLEEHPEYFDRLTTLDGIEVYRNKRAFHRAWLAPQARVIPDLDEMFDVMRDPSFDPSRVALVERPLPDGLDAAGTPLDPTEYAKVIDRTTTRVTIEVETQANRVLTLSDAYYPGWQASIDGEPTPVFPTFSVYRGIVVPKGRHTVDFHYWPWTFTAGLTLTAATCLFTLGFALKSQRIATRRR